MRSKFWVGFGYDIHRISKSRKLFLGGVQIPCAFGLAGHSDADVLLHSICDAILGSVALGDIGMHFPNTDDRYKNISSVKLLMAVNRLIQKKGYCINNIDSVIIAEKPPLAPYFHLIRNKISSILKLNKDCINIKATTPERLGALGAGKGIASYAVVLVNKK